MGEVRFTVDLDELAELIARMAACERALEQRTNEVEADIAALHGIWSGSAAEAQRLAHAEWEQGLATMRAALADIRTAAQRAHDNYTSAARTNAEMWSQLR